MIKFSDQFSLLWFYGLDSPSSGIWPKLNTCKIFDDIEFSFSALIVTVNVPLWDLSGIKNSVVKTLYH